MANIIINESDLTSSEVVIDTKDVAYIPGFSVLDPSDDTYTLGEPTFVTSVSEFERMFGTRPFYFGSDSNIGTWNEYGIYKKYTVVSYSSKHYCAKTDNPGWTIVASSEWESGTGYNAGDVVYYTPEEEYETMYFVCTNNIGSSTTTPDQDTTNWDEIYEFSESKEYEADSYAYLVDGTTTTIYKRNSGVVTAPSADTTNWATNTIDAWDDDATAYPEFTMVSYQSIIYVNKTGHNGDMTPDQDTTNWATNSVVSGAGRYNDYNVSYECDTAYLYAHTILESGLPVYYEVVESTSGGKCQTVEQIYARFSDVVVGDVVTIPSVFDIVADKGSFSIKYLTTGGYPIYKDDEHNIISSIIKAAGSRGDAIALIDHVTGLSPLPGATDNPFNTIRNLDDGFVHNQKDFGTYSAMLTPWSTYTLPTVYKMGSAIKASLKDNFLLPASFYYLVCLANSLQSNPAWLAVAGITRGRNSIIDQKGQKPVVTNNMADAYQTEGGTLNKNDAGRSIIGITNIRPYGLTIWGNRTLYKTEADQTTPASAYLSIRSLVCDVKKEAYSAAQQVMFDPNDLALWFKFQSLVSPLLDRMSTGGGLKKYTLTKQKNAKESKLCALITLYPVYPVDAIEINIELRNEEITVE